MSPELTSTYEATVAFDRESELTLRFVERSLAPVCADRFKTLIEDSGFLYPGPARLSGEM